MSFLSAGSQPSGKVEILWGYDFGEIAGKRRKYFEALGIPVPSADQEEIPEDIKEDDVAQDL